MATKNEHPEKYGWWLNELESLGVSPKRCNELNNKQEVSTNSSGGRRNCKKIGSKK